MSAFLLPPFHPNVSKRLIKSPKLFFYDVGLASYLLGIENPSQLLTHPLRGNLFENLIVTEALKHRFHNGKRNNLYFYRDSTGHEVDLVYVLADRFIAVEIKASETFNKHFLDSLAQLRELLPKQVAAEILVYGGQDTITRQGTHVTNPRGLSRLMAELETGALGEPGSGTLSGQVDG